MKYTIENNVAIIKQGIITKKIELDKITKVVWDKKINFYEGDKKILSIQASEGATELSSLVFEKYNCEQIEFTGENLFSAKWRHIPYDELEQELHAKEEVLKNTLEEYRDKFDFELCHEVVPDKYNTGAAFRVWAQKDGEKVTVTDTFGKKKIEWDIMESFLVPRILCRDIEKSILAVNDDYDKHIRGRIDNLVRYVDNGL